MKLKIYMALVEHRQGDDLYGALKRGKLIAQLYQYVVEHWKEFMNDRPIPKNMKAAVSQYFDVAKDFGHQGEFLTEETEDVELEIKDLVPAGQQRSYVSSKGRDCPHCNSTNLCGHPITSENVADGRFCQEVECHDCGAGWIDNYTLVGFSELPNVGDPE